MHDGRSRDRRQTPDLLHPRIRPHAPRDYDLPRDLTESVLLLDGVVMAG